MRTAVVGHVEWVTFVHVERVPLAGEILHPSETWEGAGGGGGVAAAQLRKLSGDCTFYTAVGGDELGRRTISELETLGIRVEAAPRERPTRRAFTFVDARGERTITTLGERLAPEGGDPLDWEALATTDAVYLTAGDVGAIRAARRARVLVATARTLRELRRAGVRLDALVGSAADPSERYSPGDLDPPPRLVVRTAGDAGGTWAADDGPSGRYDAAPLPGPVVDTYGAGDSFAAGLTYALGAGMEVAEALELAARCGAAAMTGRGPTGGQLVLAPNRGSGSVRS